MKKEMTWGPYDLNKRTFEKAQRTLDTIREVNDEESKYPYPEDYLFLEALLEQLHHEAPN